MHGLNLYDYSARYYEPALGRFTSVDPMAEKYYSTSPYVYCLNNPLKYIDPNGDTVRIYTETEGFGHAWMSVGEGDDMTVYTYGLNPDKNNFLGVGSGTMSKLQGLAAKNYLEEKSSTNFLTFTILDIEEQLVNDVLEAKLNESNDIVKQREGKTKKGEYFAIDSRNIDIYSVWTNNCATFVSDVLNKSGSNALRTNKQQQTSTFGTYTTSPMRNRYYFPVNLGKQLKSASK